MSCVAKTDAEKILKLLEALEAAGIVIPASQAPAVYAELVKRFPALGYARAERKAWTRWSEAEYAQVVELYNQGQSRREIGAALDRTVGQVNGALTRLEAEGRIKFRPDSKPARLRKNKEHAK